MAKSTKSVTAVKEAKAATVKPDYTPNKERAKLGTPVRNFNGEVVGHQVLDRKTGNPVGPTKYLPEVVKRMEATYKGEGPSALKA
jgi:hypothetical protein